MSTPMFKLAYVTPPHPATTPSVTSSLSPNGIKFEKDPTPGSGNKGRTRKLAHTYTKLFFLVPGLLC